MTAPGPGAQRTPTTVPPVHAQPDAAARADGFQRVTDALQRLGHGSAPRWLEVAALTSQEAADALGVALGQIAKCVVFRRRDDGLPVLVIASGDRRVDEQRLAAIVEPVGRADPQYVKASTGLAIGGVSPVTLLCEPRLLLDRDLQRFGETWAAAGHPNGVFRLTPRDIQRLTGAPWATWCAHDAQLDLPPSGLAGTAAGHSHRHACAAPFQPAGAAAHGPGQRAGGRSCPTAAWSSC